MHGRGRGEGERKKARRGGGVGWRRRSSQGIVTLWKPKLKVGKKEPKPLKSSSLKNHLIDYISDYFKM